MKHLYALLNWLVLGLALYADDGAPPVAGGGGTPPPAGGTPPPAPGSGGTPPAGAPPAGGTGGTPPPAPPATGPLIDPATGKFSPAFAAKYPALASKFTEPDALAGSYASLEKMIAAKGIIKPGPNATPAELDAFYEALGRPKTSADYGLKMPEKMTVDGKEIAVPKELWEAETAAKAGDLFHKLGLTKEQAQALTQFDLERGLRAKGQIESMVTNTREKCIADLKAEWPGARFDTMMKVANDAAVKVGLTPEILAANPHLSNDPNFIRAMARVGAMVLEQPGVGVRDSSFQHLDPAKEIQAIMADKNHPWQPENAKNNPKAHADAVAHMRYLYQLKHGEVS